MNTNKIYEIKAKILKKLHRHGYWGGRHTSFDNLPKGFEKSLRGKVKEAAEDLMKISWSQILDTRYFYHFCRQA